MSEPLNIQPYIDRAPTEEDRVLLTEVQASLRGGALRAAYIMTWIACAESLKRRFREAQARDSRAGKMPVTRLDIQISGCSAAANDLVCALGTIID